MVYAFILHTLLPGSCKVLFYQQYGYDGDDDNNNESEERTNRKKRIEYAASQVRSEFQFRRSVTNRTIEDDIQALNQDDQLPQFELGFLRLPADSPFTQDKIAVWLGTGNTCFTLICHKHENRPQAEAVLKVLVRYMQEYLRVLNQPAEASLKADRVCLILNRFLPDGTLMFLNHRAVRGIERELEVMMKT